MAKLSQLLTLERMLDAYDMMHTNDAWIIEKHGVCTGELLDDIIAKLVRQLNSKTRLSCRNVLVANFETMTKVAYWLKCKLFGDLPKAMGKALREKIEQMVDLLNDLMVKIINVDEFAEEFLERLKNRYLKKRHTSDYELWKARQSKLTMERLTEYQAELTANMLIMGILKYDEAPSGQEMEDVDMEKLRKKLKKGKVLPENFETECAKLRRYSHWEGDIFVIDYQLLRKYLYCMFGKLTSEQHIKMFEYDVQMKQIHEDMRKLMKEHEEDELKEEKEMKDVIEGQKEAIKKAINIMWAEGTLQHKYDHTWIMMTMNETEWLPSFATPTEYLDYMEGCGVRDRLPERSNIVKYYDRARGVFPNWTFTDAKEKEEIRRNNVGKRFLKLVQRT